MATAGIKERAHIIARMGGLDAAISSGALPETVEVSTSESLVLGLLRQGVRKFLGVLGHGNTDIGETIRVYHEAGALRFVQCRNEIAMAHAATALAWIYGETPAVLTSIGPGALQAMAGSLAAASNGIGVYHIYGDETTHGEGPNMQQIPSRRQSQFSRLLDAMGDGYTLHTPEALREALRRGTETVHRPYFAAPFYLALPINVQAKRRKLRLESLPRRLQARRVAPVDIDPYDDACRLIEQHRRIVIKAGGGTRRCALAVAELSEAADGVVVLSPSSVGVMPDAHPRNMHVGGSKGSLSGNYAMETAELLVVVGSRAVCQSDCSGTGYPAAQAVININGDIADANHYNRTVLLNGDIGAVIEALLKRWRERNIGSNSDKEWLALCRSKKSEWSQLKQERCGDIRLLDAAWGREVLTQPAAIKVAADFARTIGAVKLFDAGDVQANGFQLVEDDDPDESFTEAGSSYMGFAASAILAGALADRPRPMIAFSGDGSFVMNSQILVDAVAHGARGTIVIFDNRRMAAISSLQVAQYGKDFGTSDAVEIDFVAWANAFKGVKGLFGGYSAAELHAALGQANAHAGLSVVHVPVYWGGDDRGGLGVYGRWNVGPWCEFVEELYGAQRI